MLQSRAIKLVTDQVLLTKLVLGLYLSGDLVKDPEDASSDIHLHLVVETGNYAAVLLQRRQFLEAYYTILYFDEDDNSKIIRCVFDNGVIAYLYVIKVEDIRFLSGIKIIFDNSGFLRTKIATNINSNYEITELMNEFSFNLVKYYNYLRSENHLSILNSASRLAIVLGEFLKIQALETKKVCTVEDLQYIADDERRYKQALKTLQINDSLMAVKLMMNIFDAFINEMTIEIAEAVNIDLYLFAKERIWKL
ncbi:MAG TPA: hypothetical protein VJZ51_06745 [Bacilli bacterium]|nr:hypothetical protein [Bacilli bacterium]